MNIFSLHYLPCLYWFQKALEGDGIIDLGEHYVKQSYRNRCVILSANGPLSLTIPIKKSTGKQAMHEVQIENEFKWQKQHWEAIRSAYNTSPFFMHYKHHFEPFYTKKFDTLKEFNEGLLQTCFRLLKVENPLQVSNSYVEAKPEDQDLRLLIQPHVTPEMSGKIYMQVFTEKYPFQPNLSIMDLLCNVGPDAKDYL